MLEEVELCEGCGEELGFLNEETGSCELCNIEICSLCTPNGFTCYDCHEMEDL